MDKMPTDGDPPLPPSSMRPAPSPTLNAGAGGTRGRGATPESQSYQDGPEPSSSMWSMGDSDEDEYDDEVDGYPFYSDAEDEEDMFEVGTRT